MWLQDPRIKNIRDGHILCQNTKEVKIKLHSIPKGVSDES